MQVRELLKSTTGTRGKGQDELFAVEGYHRNSGTGVLTGVRKKTNPDELWTEYAALGFLRNTHPLALWKDKLAAFKRIKVVWLPQYVGNNVKLKKKYGLRTGLSCPF
jgi:DNA polymerase-3 subunit alpha/error-prone DNA polymerase